MPSRIYVVGPHSAGKTTLCNALLQARVSCSTKPAWSGHSSTLLLDSLSSSNACPADSSAVVVRAEPKATDKTEAMQRVNSTGTQRNAANPTLGSKYVFITETARSVMKRYGITRAQLTDQTCRGKISATNNTAVTSDSIRCVGGDQSSRDVFFHLQQLIVHEQLRRESQLIAGGCPIISDRAVVDPLAYTAERYGIQSPQVMALRLWLQLPVV